VMVCVHKDVSVQTMPPERESESAGNVYEELLAVEPLDCKFRPSITVQWVIHGERNSDPIFITPWNCATIVEAEPEARVVGGRPLSPTGAHEFEKEA
jgi:hypothetical protein